MNVGLSKALIDRSVIVKILLAVLTFIFLLISWMVNKYLLEQVSLNVDANTKTIFIGDSQVVNGINASLIEQSSSLGKNGEVLFYSYLKLKYVLNQPNRIKNVCINISEDRFSKRSEDKITDDVFSNTFFSDYYPFIEERDLNAFAVDKWIFWECYLRYRIIPNFTYIGNYLNDKYGVFNKRLPFCDSYYCNKSLYDEDDTNYPAVIKRRFYQTEDLFGHVNNNYLDSIACITKIHNKKLFLIYMPYSQDYVNIIPEEVKAYCMAKVNGVVSNYKHVVFMPAEEVYSNSYFGDYVHLNQSGATKYSKFLNASFNNDFNEITLTYIGQ